MNGNIHKHCSSLIISYGMILCLQANNDLIASKKKKNSNKIVFFQKVEFIKQRVLIVIECPFFLHNGMYF